MCSEKFVLFNTWDFSRSEALEAVPEMIGKRLVTKQTAKEGVLVEKVYYLCYLFKTVFR